METSVSGKLETALETRVQVTKWVQMRIKTATVESSDVAAAAWTYSLVPTNAPTPTAIKRISPGRGNKSSKKK